MSLQIFHRSVLGPALGIPLMSLSSGHSSSVFDDFGSAMRSVLDPFDLFGTAKGLATEVIQAPAAIVHEVTGGITAVGNTVTGVASSLENTASSLLNSPMVLIGGAAVLIPLLSK